MNRFARAGSMLAMVAGLMMIAHSAASAQATPVNAVGDFAYTTTVNEQAVSGVVSITQNDNGFTGRIVSDVLPDIPISSVTVEGRRITITALVPDTDGPLTIVLAFEDDDRFAGTWSLAGDGGSISGTRKTR